MKIKPCFMVMLVCLAGFSCKNSSEPCLESPGIPPTTGIKLRIVSKTTDSDLFLSPTSPYKPSDLVVTDETTHQTVPMFVDSTQKNDRFMYLLLPGGEPQVVDIKLAAFSTDSIATNISVVPARCFSNYVLNYIALDGKVVCTACNSPQLVTIEK